MSLHNIFFTGSGQKIFLLFSSIFLLSGCYTQFTHPQVSYGEKLGVKGDSLYLSLLEERHTDVRFDDDCKRCHKDFKVDKYFAPNRLISSREANSSSIADQSPWWRKAGYYDMEEEAVEEVSARSRRSYHRNSASSSSGGGGVNYMAAPGVLPGSGNVGSSGSAGVSANKSDSKPLPVRNKESGNTGVSQKDGLKPPQKSDKKKSSRRRR